MERECEKTPSLTGPRITLATAIRRCGHWLETHSTSGAPLWYEASKFSEKKHCPRPRPRPLLPGPEFCSLRAWPPYSNFFMIFSASYALQEVLFIISSDIGPCF